MLNCVVSADSHALPSSMTAWWPLAVMCMRIVLYICIKALLYFLVLKIVYLQLVCILMRLYEWLRVIRNSMQQTPKCKLRKVNNQWNIHGIHCKLSQIYIDMYVYYIYVLINTYMYAYIYHTLLYFVICIKDIIIYRIMNIIIIKTIVIHLTS